MLLTLPKCALLLTCVLFVGYYTHAQRSGWGMFGGNLKEWRRARLKNFTQREVNMDEDSCTGLIRQQVYSRNLSYSYGPIGLWTCYYRGGAIRSRIYYTDLTVEGRRILDWWNIAGKQTARNGLGYTLRNSPNHNGTYDSVIAQIADSQENGLRETWLVSQKDGHTYRRYISFYGAGENLGIDIYFFPDGRLENLYAKGTDPRIEFYENGQPESLHYNKEKGKLSYCYDWYRSGMLKTCYREANNHLTGVWQSFDSTGILRERGKYIQIPGYDTSIIEDAVSGKQFNRLKRTAYQPVKEGIWLEYNADGTIIKRKKYIRGKISAD